MMSKTVLLPLIAAVLLCAASPHADAQWTWRDKSGRINASDRPPPRDVPDKDILSRPSSDSARRAAPAPLQAAPASAPGSAALPGVPVPAKGPLDRELEARKRVAEQEQAARAKADEERLAGQRAENCRRARNQLAALDSGQRIARTNDKGEREVLDDRGRAEESRVAREVIASDCR